MPDARLLYRCRRCHLIDASTGTDASNILEFLVMIVHGDTPPGVPAGLYGVHQCLDENYGVSDLIGADVRED